MQLEAREDGLEVTHAGGLQRALDTAYLAVLLILVVQAVLHESLIVRHHVEIGERAGVDEVGLQDVQK
jgi:hypothetical protein